MDEQQRAALAKRLKALPIRKAIREINTMDRAANMKYWRNSRWHESHTMFELPTLKLKITLVEQARYHESDRLVGGGPDGWKAIDANYEYIDVRVEEFEPPA